MVAQTVVTHEVIVQKWEESERGWGTRPDGCSLHLTEEDRKKFLEEYWARQPKGGEVPDEYSRPDGTPYKAQIDRETFEKVQASSNGIWSQSVPAGGIDGWVALP